MDNMQSCLLSIFSPSPIFWFLMCHNISEHDELRAGLSPLQQLRVDGLRGDRLGRWEAPDRGDNVRDVRGLLLHDDPHPEDADAVPQRRGDAQGGLPDGRRHDLGCCRESPALGTGADCHDKRRRDGKVFFSCWLWLYHLFFSFRRWGLMGTSEFVVTSIPTLWSKGWWWIITREWGKETTRRASDAVWSGE